MIKIYYGRDNLDKAGFIFSQIAERGNKALLLVPDQFTLQAEREAFRYMKAESFLDFQVMSFSGLGSAVLQKCGGASVSMIDKRGRQMLLTAIMKELGEKSRELELYGVYADTPDFITMVNDLIAEFKQHNVTPEGLREILEKEEDRDTEEIGKTFIRKKLWDMYKIFRTYDEMICDKYVDSEDRIDLIEERISRWKELGETDVWIYGFDYFTPKNLRLIRSISNQAPSLNMVLTGDREAFEGTGSTAYGRNTSSLFPVTAWMAAKLKDLGEEVSWEEISKRYMRQRSRSLEHLERCMPEMRVETCDEAEGVTLVKGEDLYQEAEMAALKVTELIRDEGMRLRDILLICNDMDLRGEIYKRVFAHYGIDLFLDKKRGVLHDPVVRYIWALMDMVTGYRTEDMIKLVKTGFTDISREEGEILENYSEKYRIDGRKWKQPFEKGASEDREGLERAEEIRERLMTPLIGFAEDFKKDKTTEGRARALYRFLADEARLPEKIEELMDIQEERGLGDRAQESAQMWNMTLGMLEQMVEILPGKRMSAKMFSDLLKSGFEGEEVGVIPPTEDGLMMGTMQRTRAASPRVLMILGANEGILPAAPGGGKSILTEDEKEFLAERQLDICKPGSIKSMEEDLAIYRTMAGAKDEVWISCSASDEKGEKILPSSLFHKVSQMYPCGEVITKNRLDADAMNKVAGKTATLVHLTGYMKENSPGSRQTGTAEGRDRQHARDIWNGVYKWYRENEPELLDHVETGRKYTGGVEKIDPKSVESLYSERKTEEGRPLYEFSATDMEEYAKCPFRFFISRGLAPHEFREYEVDDRDLGIISHICMEKVTKQLNSDGKAPSDPGSLWNTVSDEELMDMVEKAVDEGTSRHREGILASDREEDRENLFRAERLKDVCRLSTKIMVDHVRKGKIRSIETEKSFGIGRPGAPLRVKDDVMLEGRIDRVDTLENGSVKIIDYKTGDAELKDEEVRMGLKLQLPLYLKAAGMNSEENDPIGAFYFKVHEPRVQGNENVREEIAKQFKMDGLLLGDREVTSMIDKEILAGDSSDVAKIALTKAGDFNKRNSKVKTREDFEESIDTALAAAEKICEDIIEGNAGIYPAKTGEVSQCRYCSYKRICKFERIFRECDYRTKPNL